MNRPHNHKSVICHSFPLTSLKNKDSLVLWVIQLDKTSSSVCIYLQERKVCTRSMCKLSWISLKMCSDLWYKSFNDFCFLSYSLEEIYFSTYSDQTEDFNKIRWLRPTNCTVHDLDSKPSELEWRLYNDSDFKV